MRMWPGPLPTLTTSRERDAEHRGEEPRPSTYQLGACYLLYKKEDWHAVPLEQVEAEIGRRLPAIPSLLEGWGLLCSSGGHGANESGCYGIASWIT